MKRIALALSLSFAAAIATPSLAGGSVSIAVDARSADEARAIRSGLALYSIYNDVKSNGHVTQKGVNHLAGLAQRGRGNVGIIHQEGRGHDASLSQTGNRNSYGIFQFGDGASGHVKQSGNGQAGLLFQIGF